MIRVLRDSITLDEASSTQDEAWRRQEKHPPAVSDALSFHWVDTRAQHAGRGRQGRPWVSQAGDLLVSCAFRLPADARVQRSLLTLVAGRALFDAVGGEAPLFLKWPNDLFACLDRPAKVAGILVEARGGAGIVVGWGVNLASGTRAIASASYRAAALGEVLPARGALIADQVKGELQNRFEGAISEWLTNAGAFESKLITDLERRPMRAQWGMRGKLKASDEEVVARGLDADGALLVSADSTVARLDWRRVLSGEFELRP